MTIPPYSVNASSHGRPTGERGERGGIGTGASPLSQAEKRRGKFHQFAQLADRLAISKLAATSCDRAQPESRHLIW